MDNVTITHAIGAVALTFRESWTNHQDTFVCEDRDLDVSGRLSHISVHTNVPVTTILARRTQDDKREGRT